ncbi:cation-transporting P-type ATPase [Fontimonas sp. SYSU GA230001]|uniref:cation-transporting P-type ATPase n=1 Tax=Fontimonas sp. SYSU GA230001 TaxID=3142450 RepID=UPI0032B519DA
MPMTNPTPASSVPRAGAEPGDTPRWHALDIESALAALQTTPRGLDAAAADARLRAHGPNRLPQPPRRSALKRLLLQFHNLLIYVLLVAAVLSLVLGHELDAVVVLAVVVINAAIGFVQEGRAERALDAIRGMVDPQASVLRDGRRTTLPAEQIVAGDIVLLEAGDRVPADLRLLRARNLRIDEAILTGESVPVEKSEAPVTADAVLGDRRSMAYSGTFITAGQATGIAVATGARTELGRISRLLSDVDTLRTPLIRQMDAFARQLTLVVLGMSVLVFAFALWMRGYAAEDAFMVVVGIAVAAIPEGLPAIMTIALAIGVQRMAARNAIVRRLPAVETLGSVSVICSDKTGTLTRNEMTARGVVVGSGEYEVGGVGYAPDGDFRSCGHATDPAQDPLLAEIARAGLLCNDADIRRTEAGWIVDGDPMEGALVTLAHKAFADAPLLRKQFPRTDEIPFDAQHRFMATLHHGHDGSAFILIKGAPERIIAMCRSARGADGDRPIDADAWHGAAEKLAAHGQRVLAFAAKALPEPRQSLSFADVDHDACLLGLVGFIDPPREEAIRAVADCRSAGIRVAMITGDHAVTAREIARQLGLAEAPAVLTGSELDRLDDAALRTAVRETAVFARTTPEHKLRLVQALQANGQAVAMTGDGVNDAPALKRADVGIAMGRKGTDAAKEAAEIVLADDNFASIVAAVREGRTVYDNVMKVIAWTLPTNGGEALTIIAAIAMGLALPITPLQILWINMVTAVALGLTLAFEPTEPGTMRRRPRAASQPILDRSLAWRIAFVSMLFVAGAFSVFFWAERRGLPIEYARTLVVNSIVAMEVFYLFSVRYVHGTALTWRGVLGTRAVLIGIATVFAAQLAFTYLPAAQSVFATRSLSLLDGCVTIAIGIALLCCAELEKRVRLSLQNSRKTP